LRPAAGSGPPYLKLEGIQKSFGARRALAGLDLEVGEGERVVVLGPTGAGKTTLLRVIAGLEAPDQGRILLGGADATALPPARRDVAFVFQNFSLYPRWSVRENLAFPLKAPGQNLAPAEVRERVEEAAELLRIAPLLERPARRLSGGEMQRVAIGRAIVRRPRVFLMDEPLTNLDAKLREALRVELVELVRAQGRPLVYVTHDPAEALTMGDRIVVLHAGRVLQAGAPAEVYFTPVTPLVARQLGSPPINLFEAHCDGARWFARDGSALLDAPGEPPGPGTVGVRPEHLAPFGGESEAELLELLETGPARVLVLRWAGVRVHSFAPRGFDFAPGDVLRPVIDPTRALVWRS
jgi:multiple sugar transport system ATP-binding protein